MNFKAFMKPELKERGTMEFPGIDAFKDDKGENIPFIIKKLSMNEIFEIRKMYQTRKIYKENGRPVISSSGQVAFFKEYDSERAGLEIMVNAFVQPKLDDPDLMSYYGVVDRLDMPRVLFANRNDFAYADQCVMEACGLATDKKKEDEAVEDIKN